MQKKKVKRKLIYGEMSRKQYDSIKETAELNGISFKELYDRINHTNIILNKFEKIYDWVVNK